jgi:hypothetical protein
MAGRDSRRFAKLSAELVKRTVAKPHKIIGPNGEVTAGWIIEGEEAA